jgi:hypothetical protein
MTQLLEDEHGFAEHAEPVYVYMHPDVTLGDAVKAAVRVSRGTIRTMVDGELIADRHHVCRYNSATALQPDV